MPWSVIPGLKYLFHREVPTYGNRETPHCSKFSYTRASKEGRFTAWEVAGFKQVIALGRTAEETKGLYIIDTGNNGNIF